MNHSYLPLRASRRPGGCEAHGTLLRFFDNAQFMLRFSSTHGLSPTERKDVPSNDEKIVYLAHYFPQP